MASVEACVPALRRYARSLVRDPQEVDDLVHDCLVQALEQLHTHRGDGDLRAWMFVIMHNLFVSRARLNQRIRARTAAQGASEDELLKSEVRELIELRWTLVEEATTSLNIPLMTVLVIWLMLIFASFGYNAPRNSLVIITFILCAGSIGGALFLVVQMDRPFEGLIKVSPAPLQNALARIRE